eukprot:264694-Rhodomonas_salina.2
MRFRVFDFGCTRSCPIQGHTVQVPRCPDIVVLAVHSLPDESGLRYMLFENMTWGMVRPHPPPNHPPTTLPGGFVPC